ncbi:MAG: uroporphyrinogen-III synthase [Alicyclobacillus sp.]|nr:uroporphyrinogen-III synthase [Alicyclobacillus sp.]
MAVTRPRCQAERTAAALRALGADARVLPLLAVQWRRSPELLAAARTASAWDAVICTSVNAVRALAAVLAEVAAAPPRKCLAVGPATAAAAHAAGWPVQYWPDVASAAALAECLVQGRAGTLQRVLYVHGQLAGSALSERLQAAGLDVQAVCGYETVESTADFAAWQSLLDAATALAVALYSPSAVRSLVRQCRSWLASACPVYVCVGPTTATAAAAASLLPVYTAANPTDAAVADLLARMPRPQGQGPQAVRD